VVLHELPDSSEDEVYHLRQDQKRVLVAYNTSALKLLKIEGKTITGTAWELAAGDRDPFGALDLIPSLDKFVFTHGSLMSIASVATGEIEATWEFGSDKCYAVKILSPDLVFASKYDEFGFISDLNEKKLLKKIELSKEMVRIRMLS
jgi:hypothetical protein